MKPSIRNVVNYFSLCFSCVTMTVMKPEGIFVVIKMPLFSKVCKSQSIVFCVFSVLLSCLCVSLCFHDTDRLDFLVLYACYSFSSTALFIPWTGFHSSPDCSTISVVTHGQLLSQLF